MIEAERAVYFESLPLELGDSKTFDGQHCETLGQPCAPRIRPGKQEQEIRRGTDYPLGAVMLAHGTEADVNRKRCILPNADLVVESQHCAA